MPTSDVLVDGQSQPSPSQHDAVGGVATGVAPQPRHQHAHKRFTINTVAPSPGPQTAVSVITPSAGVGGAPITPSVHAGAVAGPTVFSTAESLPSQPVLSTLPITDASPAHVRGNSAGSASAIGVGGSAAVGAHTASSAALPPSFVAGDSLYAPGGMSGHVGVEGGASSPAQAASSSESADSSRPLLPPVAPRGLTASQRAAFGSNQHLDS